MINASTAGAAIRPRMTADFVCFGCRLMNMARLITASRVLDACDGSDAVVDILLFWQSWAEHLVSECKVLSVENS